MFTLFFPDDAGKPEPPVPRSHYVCDLPYHAKELTLVHDTLLARNGSNVMIFTALAESGLCVDVPNIHDDHEVGPPNVSC